MNPKLTSRDIAVLVSVYHYRYLSTSQIHRLHFPSLQTAWRRLRALTALGCLKSFEVPNILERLYFLDKKGADIVAIELRIDGEELAWHRHNRQPKDYYFLKHFLAINDFRILLTKACTDIQLLGFIPEYIGEKTKDGYVKKYLRDRVENYSHTPDAVFALEKDGKPAIFFLEIDRGIEVVTDPEKGLLKAIVFYLNYWVEKGWLRYNEDFKREFPTFRLLIVTTSLVRLQHIREAVTNYPFSPSSVKQFFWGTMDSWVRVESVFEPIWQSMDVNDVTAYRIG